MNNKQINAPIKNPSGKGLQQQRQPLQPILAFDEVKKLIFNPASGGTKINMDVVMELLRTKKNSVFPMITDGEIENWTSIKDEFISLAKRNQFFLVQIGNNTSTSEDFRKAGFVVANVNGHSDIAKMVIDLTAKTYRQAISKDLEKDAKKYKELVEQ
jgi:hypothetical protein